LLEVARRGAKFGKQEKFSLTRIFSDIAQESALIGTFLIVN
jgi:hypothetical protein